MQKETLLIDGMTCGSCVKAITSAVSALDGVSQITVTLTTNSAVVEFDAKQVSIGDIIDEIEEAGFSAKVDDGSGSNISGVNNRKGPKVANKNKNRNQNQRTNNTCNRNNGGCNSGCRCGCNVTVRRNCQSNGQCNRGFTNGGSQCPRQRRGCGKKRRNNCSSMLKTSASFFVSLGIGFGIGYFISKRRIKL